MKDRTNIKPFLLLLPLFLLLFNNNLENKDNLLGNDPRLYSNTQLEEAAKAIYSKDSIKLIEELKNVPDSLIDYQEKKFNQNLLHYAIFLDNYHATKLLLERGANPNIYIYDGVSAFIRSPAFFETSKYLKLLLKYGGKVNDTARTDKPQKYKTPLITASRFRLESVKILVEKGANINYVSQYNHCALNAAFTFGKIDIIYYLIVEKDANVDIPFLVNIKGDTIKAVHKLRRLVYPLDSDNYKKKMEIVDYLMKKGYNYWETNIPKHYYKNYDSTYLEKY